MATSAQVSPAQHPGDAAARESSGGPCQGGSRLARGGGGEGSQVGPDGWPGPWPSGCPPRSSRGQFGSRVAHGWSQLGAHQGNPPLTHAHGLIPPQALVLLQLWANVDVLLVASWQELSQHVCAFTKALAQRPFKWVTLSWLLAVAARHGSAGRVVRPWPHRAKGVPKGFAELEEGAQERGAEPLGASPHPPLSRQSREPRAFSFCTAGRWAAGEQVARGGTGLRAAWRWQIQQFNHVSPAVADAVVAAFPSPRLLQQVGTPLSRSQCGGWVPEACPAHPCACPRRT